MKQHRYSKNEQQIIEGFQRLECSYQKHKTFVCCALEQQNAIVKAYDAEHKPKRLEYDRQYRKTPKGRLIQRVKTQRRHKRAQASETSFTVTDVERQYQSQKGHCYYCKRKVGDTYHVDHVIPLSRGGSNGPENIVIACPDCNHSKSDKLPSEWTVGERLL